jgi:hypothetical protein
MQVWRIQVSDVTSSGIEELYTALPQILDQISQVTGWHGMVILGGPNPSNNGDIDTIRCVISLLGIQPN